MKREAPPRDCAVCARPLTFHSGQGYIHIQDADLDHIPVPVEPGEVRTNYRCDFCNVELTGTWWDIPARDFETAFSTVDLVNMDGGEGWAACSECAPYVNVRDWRGLVRRVARSFPEPMPTESRVRLMETYRRLDEHICGPMTEVSTRP